MPAARKQQQSRAMMDIQRQGNCTKRILGSRLQNKAESRSIMRVASDPSSSRTPQSGLGVFESVGLLLNRREERAVMPASKMSASAQMEEIQLNQVCSGSAICVKRKFSEGRRPVANAWPMLTQRCS